MVRKKSRKDTRLSDQIFYYLLSALAITIILLFLGLIIYLFQSAKPVFADDSFSFFSTMTWSPTTDQYGVLAFAYGTFVTSLIALLISVPVSIGSALFLTQICPDIFRSFLRTLIELLAAIPSVVYGLWGIFILAPFIKNYIQPFLQEHTKSLPFFQGPPFGLGLFSAGLILAIMITPTITTISIEVLKSIPSIYSEGAKALGATKWESIQIAVIKPGFSGLVAAIIIGLGRAMGETMAVTMVIGNRADISTSLFSPAATMASVIANEYAEASTVLHSAGLAAVGLSLLALSVVVNLIIQIFIHRQKKKYI